MRFEVEEFVFCEQEVKFDPAFPESAALVEPPQDALFAWQLEKRRAGRAGRGDPSAPNMNLISDHFDHARTHHQIEIACALVDGLRALLLRGFYGWGDNVLDLFMRQRKVPEGSVLVEENHNWRRRKSRAEQKKTRSGLPPGDAPEEVESPNTRTGKRS